MYKKYRKYNKWKSAKVADNARKFWFFDIPKCRFTYYVFTPDEIKKEQV